MKTHLEVRPIYHWTERRIKGHFVVCFLAFLLQRTLELELRKNDEKASPFLIREALNSMNVAKVKITGKDYVIKSKHMELSNTIMKLFKVKSPANITPLEEFKI